MSYLKEAEPSKLTDLTVKQLIDWINEGKLVLNPAYQRAYVARELWARTFIGALLQRAMNSVIHIRKMPNGTYEILDGLQRLTTLKKFYDSEFKTPTYHNESLPIYVDGGVIKLPPSTMKEIQKLSDSDIITNRFYSFKLGAIMYHESMTDDEASEVFWALNDNNTLTAQEKRNGILGTQSEWVREVSRKGEKFSLLPVLRVIYGIKNDRMQLDEMVARAVQYEVWHQTKKEGIYFGYADAATLDDLYQSVTYRYKPEAFKSIAKEVERRFEIVRKIVAASGAPDLHTKTVAKVLALYQLTYALEEKFGKAVKIDYDTFAPNLWSELSNLADTKMMGIFNRKKTEFSELLGLYSPDEVGRKLAMILMSIHEVGIIKKDVRRCFSLDEKYRRWVDQDMKCAVTGEELTFDQAIGGHIIPHSKGGKTTYDNLVILSYKANADMGNTPFYEYIAAMKQAA
jgi:hypothetical protein